MTLCSSRLIYLFGFLLICFALGSAEYLEMSQGLIPCPLCIFQRFIFAFLGVFLFFGAAMNLKTAGRVIIGFFTLFISTIGILFSGRQVWIQHFPPTGGDCGASLHYLMKVYPLTDVIRRVFIGGTDCAKVDWQMLGLSLAQWSLILFVIFFALGCIEMTFALRQTKANSKTIW